MGFEPLFEASALRLLMAMDYGQAAKTCAKMLAARVPERVEAVLKAIADSGMDPWSVAIVAGPVAKSKLVPLGVHVLAAEAIQKNGGVPVLGGVLTESWLRLPSGMVGVSIPIVECGNLQIYRGTGVVFPVLRKAQTLTLDQGDYSFPALESVETVQVDGAAVDVPVLADAGCICIAAGSLSAPSLVSVADFGASVVGKLYAPILRVIRSTMSLVDSPGNFPELAYCAGLTIARDSLVALPSLVEVGFLRLEHPWVDVRLGSLRRINAGLDVYSDEARDKGVIALPSLESLAGGCDLHQIKTAEPFWALKRVVGTLCVKASYNVSMPSLEYVLGDVDATGSDGFSAPRLASVALSFYMAGAIRANVPLAQGMTPLQGKSLALDEIEISSDLGETEVA